MRISHPAISGERRGPVIVVKRVSLKYLARERSLTLMRHYYALESGFSRQRLLAVHARMRACSVVRVSVNPFQNPGSLGKIAVPSTVRSHARTLAITRESSLPPPPSVPSLPRGVAARREGDPSRLSFAAGILMRASRKPRGRGVNLFVASLFGPRAAREREREGGRSGKGWWDEDNGGG